MVKKIYSANVRRDGRSVRPGVVFSALLVVLFAGGLSFVVYDLSRNPQQIDDSNNEAILGRVVSSTDEYQTVETSRYTMKIPKDWRQVNRPEIIVNGVRYYPDRYQGIKQDSIGRWIDVFVNEAPNLPVDKVVNIRPLGDSMRVGEISPQCWMYTDLKDPEQKQSTESTWEDMSFLCSMNLNENDILAVHEKATNGIRLEGEEGSATYSFFFSDRGSKQDNRIFQNILESFRAK